MSQEKCGESLEKTNVSASENEDKERRLYRNGIICYVSLEGWVGFQRQTMRKE